MLGLPQFFNHIFVLISRNYVSLANEKCVLDQSEAFSHGCMVVIRFHFLLQSSEFYWPFGLVFCQRKLNSLWSELVVSLFVVDVILILDLKTSEIDNQTLPSQSECDFWVSVKILVSSNSDDLTLACPTLTTFFTFMPFLVVDSYHSFHF